MSRPVVRAATPADVSFLVEANQALARETEDKTLDSRTLTVGVETALADPQRGHYWVAELDGEPAGCLLITREWSDWRNRWIWWIQSVYVRPAARGRRLYRALHEHVLAAGSASNEVSSVRLYVDRNNHDARAVYERLGMQVSRYDLMEQEL